MISVYKKYMTGGINDDLGRDLVLRAFSAVINGRIGRMTFKMTTDEQMRAVLDDQDYEIWIKAKEKYLAESA